METISDPFPPSDEEHFRAEVLVAGDRAIVRLEGELDLGTADELRDTVLALVAEHPTLVLDLRALDFMDSTGISVVIECDNAAQERGTGFYVVRGPEQVQRVLALTGVEDHIAMIGHPDEAVPASAD